MTNERMRFTTNAERDTYVAMKMLGYEVEYHGQQVMTTAAREILRGVHEATKYIPDFLACRPAIIDRPRWPAAIRDKYPFLVDAKWRWEKTRNHTIEMRSYIAGPTFGMDLFYVCSTRYGDECREFGVVEHGQILRSRWRPCCTSCGATFTDSADPMHELPDYCPNQERSRRASKTPYILFPESELHPLSAVVFDIISPTQLARLGPPHGLRECA